LLIEKMLRHLFTLMWNRKRANGLLVLEIVLAFVVLFAVGSVGAYLLSNYQAPLGFEYEHVWHIHCNAGAQPEREQFATWQQVVRQVRATPGVLSVARTSGNTPYSTNMNSTNVVLNKGKDQRESPQADYSTVGPELRDLMHLKLTEGRWFDRRDEASTHRPAVITESLRKVLFRPGEPVIGRVLDTPENAQIVGVISAYRQSGELQEPRPGILFFVGPQDTASALNTLLVRVQPGAGAVLEKKISDEIRAINPTWSSTIAPLAEERRTQLKQGLAIPVLEAVVCVFLLVNVALGLFGVLWLNINQRRAELGVRRALGATGAAISWQVLGEILVLTTFGLVLGLLVAAQFPLLGVFEVQIGAYLTSMALATVSLYALAAACALYPSRLAAGIQPAVALREE
jgi:putative ABC transport system permease protein